MNLVATLTILNIAVKILSTYFAVITTATISRDEHSWN
ncbi:Uncharacterised protein [Mycoplasmopsis citelli]|uniref:Uncharacterized protein n=1 Tax=Mycoplasmopsis citelli TaxID=171281 RepID=A0A449B2V6_9BACT|nr:Uncharacterised protein [Mycoplasmopsis citelli]